MYRKKLILLGHWSSDNPKKNKTNRKNVIKKKLKCIPNPSINPGPETRVRPALSVTPLCPSEHQAAADRGDWHLQGAPQPSKDSSCQDSISNILFVGNMTSMIRDRNIAQISVSTPETSNTTTSPNTSSAMHVIPHPDQLCDHTPLLASWDVPCECREDHAYTKCYHDQDRHHELQPDIQHVQNVGGKHLPGCGPACACVGGAGGAPGVIKTTLTPIVSSSAVVL